MDAEFYLLLQRCFALRSDCRLHHELSRHLSSVLLWQSIRPSLYTVLTVPVTQWASSNVIMMDIRDRLINHDIIRRYIN